MARIAPIVLSLAVPVVAAAQPAPPTPWKDGAFVWGMETPMGKMRYTIRLDAQGRWHETGEGSRDGQAWTQFFEMTLTKAR